MVISLLSNLAETEKLEPFVSRNVMSKIEFNDVSENPKVSLFLGSGLRLSELVQLNIGDIDFNKNSVFVAAPMGPKGTKRRLSGRAIEKLIEKYAIAFEKPSLSVQIKTFFHNQVQF